MGRLHPTIAAILGEMATDGEAPASPPTPAQVRQEWNPVLTGLAEPPEPVAAVRDMTIPGPGGGIPIRVYSPDGPAPFPTVVYFHGGGFVIGSLDTHDGICRALANEADCVVVSVGYRLAPEHGFPAAVDDAFAAVQWAAENAASIGADSGRIAVAGDSAGANLAAVATLVAREKGRPEIRFQLLVCPCTDLTSLETDSYCEYAEGLILTKATMEWFRDLYLPREQDRQDPHASPLLAKDLSGLPPALVITAECDVLRDEGRAYADRLKQAGVPTTYSCYPGMIHLFWGMAAIHRCQSGIDEAAAALRLALEQ
jgi:acetyl esterase